MCATCGCSGDEHTIMHTMHDHEHQIMITTIHTLMKKQLWI